MTWKLAGDAPAESSIRPLAASHQSNSLPSTPYHRSRNLSLHSRSPSPHGGTSPRSIHSETTHFSPLSKRPRGECKYETAMAYFRRRMPYTLGSDLLPEENGVLHEQLGHEEEQKLTADIMRLYGRLLPSAESEARRQHLVCKLEKLFNDQWPGRDIKVHIFGSSGNKLYSSDSDVDICITTRSKELEKVCLLAEVLANHGMERVVCVSHAKVPIVKIWDPELRLACDMNVNNTLALENTRMIRTYVEVDDRVRPLAMIIKHWTKRRVLNDAAFGGTLSSYTWICLIINFLQTRKPPVLPSLQSRPHEKKITADGLVCSFDDDLGALRGYGRKNKQTLGALLFDFFRYYAHEISYEKSVVSVREGNLLSKEAKGWHLLQNNRLCVEEPFNTSRNLGNTADDSTFRGVHLELRRAFQAIASGRLDNCCEQYEFPLEEERCFERPPPQPRPVLTAPSQSYRSERGGSRGGRYSSHSSRGGFNGRRSSHAASKAGSFRHGSRPPDLSYQTQQAQFFLHDQLYQQIQILQAQEQELRMQLQSQALLTGRPPPMLIRQPFMQFHVPEQHESVSNESTRARSNTVNHLPPNALMHQNVYYSPGYFSFAVPGLQGSSTNPPSPSAMTTHPELRRSPWRSPTTNGSSKGLNRAHSQPARSLSSLESQVFGPLYPIQYSGENFQDSKQWNKPVEGMQGGEKDCFTSSSAPNSSRSNYLDENQQSEFASRYLAGPSQSYEQDQIGSPVSSPVGLSLQQCGFLSFAANPEEYISLLRSNEAVAPVSDQISSLDSQNSSSRQQFASQRPHSGNQGPLIVDGSVPLSELRSSAVPDGAEQYAEMSHCTSNSDDPNMDTPVSISDSFSQDFQDNSSVETDQGSLPVWKSATSTDFLPCANAASNNHHLKPGLLSSRLQNLHIANNESLLETRPHTGPERQKMAFSYQEMAAKEVSRLKQPVRTEGENTQAVGRPLVAELNGQPPDDRLKMSVMNNPGKAHGPNQKTALKGRPHSSKQALATSDAGKDWQAGSHRMSNESLPETHGPTPLQCSGGWQISTRKNRRSNRTLGSHRRNTNSCPDSQPVSESFRKGG